MGSDTHLNSGNASAMRRTGRPEPSDGVRVAARWDSSRIGRGAHTIDHGVGALGAVLGGSSRRCSAWVRLGPSTASAPGSSHALAPPRRWRSTASTSADRARPIRRQLRSPDESRGNTSGLLNFSALRGRLQRSAGRVLLTDLAGDRPGLGPREEWGSVPIAATWPRADHRHHDNQLLDPAERRSVPFRERCPASGWRVVSGRLAWLPGPVPRRGGA